MTPEEYCSDRAAQSGSSFYYSFLFLPPPRRAAITALYAFCREVDDIVDECSDSALARTKLEWWRAEIGRLASGQPTHPVTLALGRHVQAYQIGTDYLMQIIDGMEMDLIQNRYLDFAGLRKYCYHVAGVVGILAARVFGANVPETMEYAESLGIAFQLTNIIRDVGEDARKGRIYLPADDLRRFGVPASDILNANYGPKFVELMQFQAGRARQAYQEAFAKLHPSERRSQRPGLIMAGIYQTLLEEIEREDFRVLHQRIALTPLRKFWIAWRTWISTR